MSLLTSIYFYFQPEVKISHPSYEEQGKLMDRDLVAYFEAMKQKREEREDEQSR